MIFIKKLVKKLLFAAIRRYYPYQMDGLITCHSVEFLSDPNFLNGYSAAYEVDYRTSFKPSNWYIDGQIGAYLIYTTQFFAEYASRLAGDFVECGTWRGRHALSILKYFECSNISFTRKFYLFDTFKGLSDLISDISDVEHYNNDYSEDVLDEVCERFKEFDCVDIVPGVLPFSLHERSIEHISFLMMDLNSGAAEVACLELLFPRIVKGGVIIFDDYGQTGHIRQKRMIDNFFNSKGLKVYACPTRQGIVFI